MNLIFRLIWIVIKCLSRPVARNPELPSRLNFRVMPTDCDLNMHMTNARYFSFMDLGRVDVMLKTAIRHGFFKERWGPMIGTSFIRFRRALPPFTKFQLVSDIIDHDDKWIYMEQRIEVQGELYAVAYFKGLFRAPDGNVESHRVMQKLNRSELVESRTELPTVFYQMEKVSRQIQ